MQSSHMTEDGILTHIWLIITSLMLTMDSTGGSGIMSLELDTIRQSMVSINQLGKDLIKESLFWNQSKKKTNQIE